MSQTFDRIRFVLAPSLEEALVAELWARGTLGLETWDGGLETRDGGLQNRESGTRRGATDRITIDAWYPAGAVPPGTFGPWRDRGVEVERDSIGDEDYLETYRALAKPFEVGQRFVLDSRDPDDASPPADLEPGRFLLRIPARVAFGTGSHETTRAMLETLETLDLERRSVLDVGTGSGILAFACLRLGARSVLGFDLDSPSVLVARQNVALNPWPVAPSFFAGRFDALRAPRRGSDWLEHGLRGEQAQGRAAERRGNRAHDAASRRYDVVLVNVLPERIRGDEARIAQSVAPGGMLVVAGALERDRAVALHTWSAVGFVPIAEHTVGEWICFRMANR